MSPFHWRTSRSKERAAILARLYIVEMWWIENKDEELNRDFGSGQLTAWRPPLQVQHEQAGIVDATERLQHGLVFNLETVTAQIRSSSFYAMNAGIHGVVS